MATATKSKWIQKAKINKGAFTKKCGGKVTKTCIEKGKKSPNSKTRKQAVLAQTLTKIAKKKSSK